MSQLLLPREQDAPGFSNFALPTEVLGHDMMQRPDEGRRVVMLSGPAAVGKTALINATRAARRVVAEVSPEQALHMADYSDAVQNVCLVSDTEDYRERFFKERVRRTSLLSVISANDDAVALLARSVNDERFVFVENASDDFAGAARTLRDVALGYIDVEKSERARQSGRAMLSWLEESCMLGAT